MSKNTLYIGVDTSGEAEIGPEILSWNDNSNWWTGPGSSNLDESTAMLLEKVFDLEVWPETGELLVYDVVKEKGYIVSHSDL